MQIRQGKFYESKYDKVPVPIQFGNREQIKAFQQAQRTLEKLENITLKIYTEDEPESEIECSTKFKCICGENIHLYSTYSTDSEEQAIERFIEYIDGFVSCRDCNQRYALSIIYEAFAERPYGHDEVQAEITPILK